MALPSTPPKTPPKKGPGKNGLGLPKKGLP